MNKYEALFKEISALTKNGGISWSQISRSANSDLIFNSSSVFRQFKSKMEKSGNTYVIYFIEKKRPDPEYDFEIDKYSPEILVVDDQNELVAMLSDSIIDRHDLYQFAGTVESKSDRASKLFQPKM